MLLAELLGRHLRVGRRVGMDDEALHVGHVGQQREDLEGVAEAPGLLLASLHLEGEDRSAALRIVFLVEGMVGMVGQRGMVDPLHLGMVSQKLDHAQGVAHVALHAQRERLESLQQDPGVEGRDGSARVAQDDGTYARDEGRRSGHVGEDGAGVRRVGLGQRRILVGILLPGEGAAVDDDAAEAGAVAADELRGRVDHDVGAVLDGAYQVGRAERVVDDEGDAMAMGHLGDGLNVSDVAVGIAERLGVDGLRIGLDSSLEGLEVVDVDDGVGDALRRQRVGDEVERTAVEVVGRHDVVARLTDVLQGIGDGGGARGHGQCGHATLECGQALFEDVLGRVGQPAVDVARIAQGEAVGGML